MSLFFRPVFPLTAALSLRQHRSTAKQQHPFLSNVGALFDAAQHLIEPVLVEPDHHLAAGDDDGDAPGTRGLNHLIESSPVLAHVKFLEGEPFLRKKLLRMVTVGSGRRRIKLDLFGSHGVSSLCGK
jgi:hypothetical protein